MNDDLRHLRLLSAFHYVVAVMVGLFSLIPVIHLTVGIALATGGFGHKDMPAPVPVIGVFIAVFAALFILGGSVAAVCLAVAGASLASQRRYTFCFVMAAIACVFFPFGTVLGVFTVLVLSRESVKQLFDKPAAPAG